MKYELIRSDRRSLGIEIRPDGQLVVRAPRRLPLREINRVLEEKKDWIETHRKRVQEAAEHMDQPPFTREEIRELADRALEYIPKRVAYYAPLVGVSYGRITIRNQRTRWGSCSAKGNLNFNCLLMLMPPEVIDSVVVHELCHRKEMNHSKGFYQEVLRVFPEYEKWNKWLRDHGPAIIKRI